MPAAIGRLQRVRVLEESTFATDMSGSWGTAIDARAIGPVDPDPPPNMPKDDSLRRGPWEDRLDFLGPRGRAKVAPVVPDAERRAAQQRFDAGDAAHRDGAHPEEGAAGRVGVRQGRPGCRGQHDDAP